MIRAQVSWWPGNVSVGGTHVHHLVWGICAMMICGYVGLVVQPDSPWQEIMAVLFAIGTGLTLDEFALWLELKDVYWSQDGRKSVDAMIIAGCIAGMLLVGYTAWIEVATDVEDAAVAFVGFATVTGLVVALVNASKEKFAMAALALLAWPFARPVGDPAREAELVLGAPPLRRREDGAGARALPRPRRARGSRLPILRRPPAGHAATLDRCATLREPMNLRLDSLALLLLLPLPGE